MLGSLGVAAFVAFMIAAATAGSVIANKREAAAARAELERYKTEAGERATANEAETARANEEAKRLSLKTEELRAANLKLEERLTPRKLSEEQVSRIVSKLKPFTGTPFSLAINPTVEPQAFAAVITKTLRAAGWKPVSWEPPTPIALTGPGIPNSGVVPSLVGLAVEIDGSRKPEWMHNFLALADALRVEGFKVDANVAMPEGASPTSSIRIFVGAKP